MTSLNWEDTPCKLLACLPKLRKYSAKIFRYQLSSRHRLSRNLPAFSVRKDGHRLGPRWWQFNPAVLNHPSFVSIRMVATCWSSRNWRISWGLINHSTGFKPKGWMENNIARTVLRTWLPTTSRKYTLSNPRVLIF